MAREGRITLSGRNNLEIVRTVYFDGEEIGEVVPVRRGDTVLWEARDYRYRPHGDKWLSDWYAAEALVNALGLRAVPNKERA